jgi:hypothetical protein
VKNNVSGFELERFVDRHLRALPAPSAPSTLLPRVLAAARAWSGRPWYTREWFTWPLGWQVGSLALLALTMAAAAIVGSGVQPLVSQATASLISSVTIDVPQISSGVQAAATTLRVIWQALVQPFLPYVFAVIVLMCLVLASVVLALDRLVFGRASHS